MKTMYREPLTAEEINLHKNNYEDETPAVYIGEYSLYNEGNLFGMWCNIASFDSYEELLEFAERLFAFLPDVEPMFYQKFMIIKRVHQDFLESQAFTWCTF